MSDALKAAVLDLKTLRANLKMVPVLLLVGIVMETSMETAGFVTVYAATIIIALAAYPFGAEEKSRLHLLQLSLPVSRRAIVAGRYIQAAVVAAVMALVSCALSFAVQLARGLSPSFGPTAAVALSSCVAALLIVAFQYPFFYRMGYMKARYLVNVPLFLVIMLAPQLKALQNSVKSGTLADALRFVTASPAAFAACLLSAAALFIGLSFLFSYRLFRAKDL